MCGAARGWAAVPAGKGRRGDSRAAGPSPARCEVPRPLLGRHLPAHPAGTSLGRCRPGGQRRPAREGRREGGGAPDPQHPRPGALRAGGGGAAPGQGAWVVPLPSLPLSFSPSLLRLLGSFGKTLPARCQRAARADNAAVRALILEGGSLVLFWQEPRAADLCLGWERGTGRGQGPGKGGRSPGHRQRRGRGAGRQRVPLCLRDPPALSHRRCLVVAGVSPLWWPWEPASSVTRSRGSPPGSGRSARAGPTRSLSSGKGPRWASTSASSSSATGAGTARPWASGRSSARSSKWVRALGSAPPARGHGMVARAPGAARAPRALCAPGRCAGTAHLLPPGRAPACASLQSVPAPTWVLFHSPALRNPLQKASRVCAQDLIHVLRDGRKGDWLLLKAVVRARVLSRAGTALVGRRHPQGYWADVCAWWDPGTAISLSVRNSQHTKSFHSSCAPVPRGRVGVFCFGMSGHSQTLVQSTDRRSHFHFPCF